MLNPKQQKLKLKKDELEWLDSWMDCYFFGTLAAKLSLAIEICISIDDQNQQLWELDSC